MFPADWDAGEERGGGGALKRHAEASRGVGGVYAADVARAVDDVAEMSVR